MSVSDHHFDAALLGRIRPNVPDAQRVVHRVGEDVGAVRAECQPCHRVRVAFHRVKDGVLPQVPHLDIVIDSGRDDLVGCVVECYGQDLVQVVQGRGVGALPRVPHFDGAVVGRTAKELRTPSSRVDSIDESGMA